MSGFLITTQHAWPDPGPWPVSLDPNSVPRQYRRGSIRLAVKGPVWRDPWHRALDGRVWIDGTPAHMPSLDLTFSSWLANSDGSFRAIFFSDDRPDSVVLASDRYGSRPIFVDMRHGMACADKMVSLFGLIPNASLNWPVLLESLALGCVLSRETCLEAVAELEAGCRVELVAGRQPVVTRYATHPLEGDSVPPRGLLCGAQGLSRAVQDAVQPFATTPGVHLLLSGGFDSRWVLAHSGAAWKTLTLAPAECHELRVARRIAAACGVTHETKWTHDTKWQRALAQGHLITGGLFDPLKNHFLDAASEMAASGVRRVAHAYLFDTLMKGYFVYPVEGFQPPTGSLFPPMAFRTGSIIFTPDYLLDLSSVLSATGRQLLGQRMRQFDEDTPACPMGGFEFGLERRVLRHISRQIDMPMAYNLMEFFDVCAPIYSSAIWEWTRSVQPGYRKPCLAFPLALMLSGGRVAWIRKADGGQLPVAMLTRSLLARSRVVKAVRARVATLRPARPPSGGEGPAPGRSAWGVEDIVRVLCSDRGRQTIATAIAALENEPCFESLRIGTLMDDEKQICRLDPHLVAYLCSLGNLKLTLEAGGDKLRLDAPLESI